MERGLQPRICVVWSIDKAWGEIKNRTIQVSRMIWKRGRRSVTANGWTKDTEKQ